MDLQSLYPAIEQGDISEVARLLDECPDLIHVKNKDKEKWDEFTALHCAAKHGHLEIVRFLVERGAEVYSHPLASYPPVIIAAWNEYQSVVDYFLSEIPGKAEGTNKLGVTINLAARLGWVDLVRKHIKADPLAVYQRGWIGDTPLHWPAHNGQVEILRILLEVGADIEADEINCYGGKPLHWASEHEPAAVRLLLERGANVNARNIKKDSKFLEFTPLIMNATQKDDCGEVTEILLKAGADIKATDAHGKTALGHAMVRKNENIISVLRSY